MVKRSPYKNKTTDPEINHQYRQVINATIQAGRHHNPKWGRDPSAVGSTLPDGAKIAFDWQHPPQAKDLVGYWVWVLRDPIGPDRYEKITTHKFDKTHWEICTASGTFRRSQQVEPGVFRYLSDWIKRPSQLKVMGKVAQRWAYHGDLARAIVEVKPTWSARSQRIKYSIYANSPYFKAMARKALLEVLKENGIDEDYLVSARKAIIEQATTAKDFNSAEKALKGLEQIMAAAQAQEDDPLPGLEGAIDIDALLEAKRQQFNLPPAADSTEAEDPNTYTPDDNLEENDDS